MAITVEMRTQVSQLYVALFGRAPDGEGLAYWVGLLNAGQSMEQVGATMYATEPARSYYPGFLTNEEIIESFYVNVLGRNPDAEGLAYWTGKLNAPGATPASVLVEMIDVVANYAGTDPAGVESAALFNNRVEVAQWYGEENGSIAGSTAILEGVTSDPATVDAAIEGGVAQSGLTFTLTTDIAGTEGTSGNDTFKGTINHAGGGADNLSTIQTGDIVNGGSGADTLEITLVDDTTSTPLVELNSVETVKVRALSSSRDVDASLWSGVTTIASVKSLDDVSVINVQEAANLWVENTDQDLSVQFADDLLGTDASITVTVNNAGEDAATRATVEVVDNGTTTDTITTLKIVAAGGESFIATDGLIGDQTIETLVVTGTGKLDIQEGSDRFDDATVVDLSGNSGGVTVEVEHEDVVVTGGSGDDVVSLRNGATALTDKAGIALGAGNDSLLDTATSEVGTDAVLDGGEGSDTIASTLLEVGNQANIQNFEILDLAGETRTIDASLFSKSTFQSLALSAATGAATTVTKLAGTSIVLDVEGTAAINNATAITATLATATGTSDTGVINFNNDGNATLSAFNTAGLETITVNSNAANAADDNEVTDLNTTDNVLTKIVITGDNQFTLGDVDTNTSATTATADVASSLTLIDGSAATGDLFITAGASAAIGASGFNTTYTGLTIKTGEGDDTVSIGGRGTVETGVGADTVNVAVAGVSVNVGSDEVVDTVNLAVGTVFTAAATTGSQVTNFTGSSRVTTISNLEAGDVIDLTAITTTDTIDGITDYTTTALTFGSLEAAINAAVAALGDDASSYFNWVDGNTYIVVDGAATAAGGNTNENDAVIKLVGTYDFVAADLVNQQITIA